MVITIYISIYSLQLQELDGIVNKIIDQSVLLEIRIRASLKQEHNLNKGEYNRPRFSAS